MNDNANYILELLRSGMSVDDIAKQMTDALNEASIAHKAEEAAKREAEEKAKLAKEEETKREEKREYLAAEVGRAMQTYIKEFYPNLGDKFSAETFAKSFIETCEMTAKLCERLDSMNLEDLLGELLGE